MTKLTEKMIATLTALEKAQSREIRVNSGPYGRIKTIYKSVSQLHLKHVLDETSNYALNARSA